MTRTMIDGEGAAIAFAPISRPDECNVLEQCTARRMIHPMRISNKSISSFDDIVPPSDAFVHHSRPTISLSLFYTSISFHLCGKARRFWSVSDYSSHQLINRKNTTFHRFPARGPLITPRFQGITISIFAKADSNFKSRSTSQHSFTLTDHAYIQFIPSVFLQCNRGKVRQIPSVAGNQHFNETNEFKSFIFVPE